MRCRGSTRRWCRRGISGGPSLCRRLWYVVVVVVVRPLCPWGPRRLYLASQVRQGYFDILFPTDFAVMEAVYQAITGKLTRVVTHEDFMKRWAYVDETRTKSGESPLLSWYQNASVMTTV